MNHGTSLFLYGTLLHGPLLEAVLGRPSKTRRAHLRDHSVHAVAGEPFPMIQPDPGTAAEGVLLEGLSEQDLARLDFYEGAYGFNLGTVSVIAGAATAEAHAYYPEAGLWQADGPWDLSAWVEEWGAVTAKAAVEFMALHGSHSPQDAARAYPQIMMRAQSALRAEAKPAPASLRNAAEGSTVEITARRRPHVGYFAVSRDDLRFPRFDGTMSETVTREAFLMPDAVTVLPYDPKRDRVLVIEQYRYGMHMRGDPRPWSLEPIAGRIDPGETPEETAHRETAEEAGITLSGLHSIGRHYPSPGAVSEFLHSFVGLADLPDDASRIGGLLSEHEDIRAHVIPFDRLMQLVDTGEAGTSPLVLSAYWLALNRSALG